MNAERNIDDELKSMWDRAVNKVTTTTTRVRNILHGDKQFKDVEEKVAEHDGALEIIKRGVGTIWGGFNKKKK